MYSKSNATTNALLKVEQS